MPAPSPMAQLEARWRGRRNRKSGEDAQDLVANRLTHAGLVMVEPVETGFRLQRKFDSATRTSRIIGASPAARVAGDFRAVVPGTGRSVLVEVKWRQDGQLSLSDFEAHQGRALTTHGAAGGLSLVAWVTPAGVELLAWPIAGLVKGKPLTVGDPRVAAARWKGIDR